MLRKMTVKHKIFFLAALGVFLAAGIATGSMLSINAVGKKLAQIVKVDVPLTGAVTTITLHQLEQEVMFERATRYAEIMEHQPAAAKHYRESKAKFFKLAKTVDAEIIAAEDQALAVVEHEKNEGGDPKIIKEFEHVYSILKKIEKEHGGFDHQVEKVFKLFEQGRLRDAEHMAEQVEVFANKLDHELKALLAELKEFTNEAVQEVEKLEKNLLKILMIVTVLVAILFTLVAMAIARGIIRPLAATKNYADEISAGNLEVDQPVHNFEDEIADMMSSLSVFKDNAIEASLLREQQKQQEIRAELQQKQAMQDLANSFDQEVGGVINALAAASTELQSSAESMRVIADETSQASSTVASSSEEASANVSTVASAMEEMSASSQEISTQVTSAKTQSNDTAENAERANHTVGNLNQLVENIGSVVVAIQDIAEQTNLLALNATIEAARAGDAGKGFAVVADEVKKLATETGQKTEEINTRINEIQDATRSSVEAMERIISNISEIDGSVTGVSAAVEEQNATTNEIVRSVSEASQGVQQVSEIIMEVQKGAGETGTSADAVLGASKEVAQLSDSLKNSVDGLLLRIRTDNAIDTPPSVDSKDDVDASDEGDIAEAAE